MKTYRVIITEKGAPELEQKLTVPTKEVAKTRALLNARIMGYRAPKVRRVVEVEG